MFSVRQAILNVHVDSLHRANQTVIFFVAVYCLLIIMCVPCIALPLQTVNPETFAPLLVRVLNKKKKNTHFASRNVSNFIR